MDTPEAWTEQVRQLLEYHREAGEFLQRVRQRFPQAHPRHIASVARLWLSADDLDPLVCSTLEDLNRAFLEGRGDLDLTRGASLRPDLMGREVLYYECAWTLTWDGGALRVRLSVEAGEGSPMLEVSAEEARERERLAYPVDPERFRQALGRLFALERAWAEVRDRFGEEADRPPAPPPAPPMDPLQARRLLGELLAGPESPPSP